MTPRPPFALLLDAAGTLLQPAEPVAQTYAEYAARFGGHRGAPEIASAFAEAFAAARPHRSGDPMWRTYWQRIVAHATGVAEPALFEALYQHYAEPEAWRVADGAVSCIDDVRARGGKVAVVSNWDTRLRALLDGLGLTPHLDTAVISGIEGMEKPDPAIFLRACERLGIDPSHALHVGDSLADDIAGARAAGCRALLMGRDVESFAELSRRLREPPFSAPDT